MRPFRVSGSAVRGFAVGIFSLATLVAMMVLLTLTFPYGVIANQSTQSELLYDLLGHLEHRSNGQFTMIDDPVMSAELVKLVKRNDLDSTTRTAYIINRHTRRIVWSAASFDLDKLPPDYAYPFAFDLSKLADNGYKMQFITAKPIHSTDPQSAPKAYELAVQNFWIPGANGIYDEYQMVVAFPLK